MLAEHVFEGAGVGGGEGRSRCEFGAVEVAAQIAASALRCPQCLAVGLVGVGDRLVGISIADDVLSPAGRVGAGGVGRSIAG